MFSSVETYAKKYLYAILVIVLALGMAPVQAAEPTPQIPFLKAWTASPHADRKSESFRHWDKDGKIPKACATCHSSDGFRDFIGADGSAAGVVNAEPATDTVITCITCHNEAASDLNTVTFPSGVSIVNTGKDSRCMTCHQGRQSGADVDAAVKDLPVDKPNAKLKFINVHYRAAAATLWGSMAKIGYQYPDAKYQGRYEHANQLNQCVDCHNPHSLQVRVSTCVLCHEKAVDTKNLPAIRQTKTDYDGDGDVNEGMADELTTLQERLLTVMQTYARRVAKKAIAYESHTYPYFFTDKNKNRKADPEEAVFKNQYKSWTPRLLKAAYNYQFALKDPGAYAHNPRYVIQLLHDSLADLSGPTKMSMDGLIRP
jgi:hypothetical protein